jgi:hypothetical protein
MEKFDQKIAFNFLISPINNLNKDMYHRMLMMFKTEKIMKLGSDVGYLDDKTIANQTTLKMFETENAEIDLFLSMSNNRTIGKYIERPDFDLRAYQLKLTDIINGYLVKKKTEQMKFCRECSELLPMGSRYATCRSCYTQESYF